MRVGEGEYVVSRRWDDLDHIPLTGDRIFPLTGTPDFTLTVDSRFWHMDPTLVIMLQSAGTQASQMPSALAVAGWQVAPSRYTLEESIKQLLAPTAG